MTGSALQAALAGLHDALRSRLKKEWNRSLPFEDELFPRDERAKFLGFGEGTTVYQQSYVFGDVKVGRNTWIGPGTVLDGSGGLEIGDFCSISAGVHVYSHDTVKWALTGGKAKYERSSVHIGSCCHIGAHAVIVKGVTIGDHCVVGAHAFVNRDIPPWTVVAGVPARPIMKIERVGDDDVRLVKIR